MYCESDNEVIETLSYLQCSNPKCISKIGYRLYCLLKDLGIQLLTVEDCMSFLEGFETENPYSIFLYNPKQDGELYKDFGMENSLKLYEELNKKRGMLLWEYVKIGHFNNLEISAEKILGGYNNLKVFFDNLIKGGIPFVQELLLKDTEYESVTNDICVDAVLIYETLLENKEDLEEGLNGVVIINPEVKMSVLFANDTTEFSSNRDFLHSINNRLQNKIYLYPVFSLTKDTQLVYWEDYDVKTYNTIIEKVKTNEEYKDIKIINKDNIFNVLLEVLRHE